MGLKGADLRRLPNIERVQRFQSDWLSAQLTALEYTLETAHYKTPYFSLDALIVQHLFERAREYHDGAIEHWVANSDPENVRRRRWFFAHNNTASGAQHFAELVNRYGLRDDSSFQASLDQWISIDTLIEDLLFDVDGEDDDEIDQQLIEHFEAHFGLSVRTVLERADNCDDAYKLPYMMQLKAKPHSIHHQQVLTAAQLSEELVRPILQLPVDSFSHDRIAFSNASTRVSPVNISVMVEGLIHRGTAPVVTLEWNEDEFNPATAVYKTLRDPHLRGSSSFTVTVVGLSRSLLGRVTGFFAQASEGPVFGDNGLFFIDTRSLNLRTQEVSSLVPNN